jgi:hypothetical protein
MSAAKRTSKSSIQDKIRPVGEIPSYLTMLVYGEAGSGKTAFASTFPKPLLLLDLKEKGTETIAKVEGVDVLSIDTWDEFEEAYWMLDAGTKYESVVLDQISTLQGLAMEKVRTDNDMKATDTFSRRDWGQISGLMQTWLLNYRNLWDKELHVCMNAHQRITAPDEDEGSGEDQIEPSVGARVMPSISSFINGAVSSIGNTFIRERYVKNDETKKKDRFVDYCMRVGPHAFYRTKIRRPPDSESPIPDVIVNPTFEKIMKLSRGESITKSKAKRSK